MWKWKKVKLLSRVRLFVIPWTVAYQASLSMGFLQARILEWVTISFSRGSSRPRDQTWVSCIGGRRFNLWAIREAQFQVYIKVNQLYICMKVKSSLTLCNPMDCSPPGSSVHGIFQTRVLEWVAISFSRGSSQPRDRTQVSHTAGRCFTV